MVKKEGMTLMELIIVLAMIAALAGFAFAIINKVRQRAYLGQCVSNLSQLVLAVRLYENDWGTVPIEHLAETPEGDYGFVQQMLSPYVSDSRLFLCPADFTGGRYLYGDAYDETGPDNPRIIRWRGREWLTSYNYCVNDVVVRDFGKGSTRLRSDSPLFECPWHLPHFKVVVIARYNGKVEVVPEEILREFIKKYGGFGALFEGVHKD